MSVLSEVMAARTPGKEALHKAVDGLSRAVETLPSSQRLADLGVLEFLVAQDSQADATMRAITLASAQQHLEQSLAMNAAQGLAWYRLAQVRQARNPGDTRAVVSALMNSIDMAPNMQALWTGRSVVLIWYRQYLTQDEMRAFTSNLHTSWFEDAGFRLTLVRMLGASKPSLDFLEQALGSDVEAQEQLRKLRPR